MRVKRYVADSIQEAIARVKNDLGRNAIILHTKPFKDGGFLGLFSQRRFEVIAAVDENANDQVPRKNELKPEMPTPPPVNSAVNNQTNQVISNFNQQPVSNLHNNIPVQPVPIQNSPGQVPVTSVPSVPTSAPAFPTQRETAPTPSEPALSSLREEIAEMKELIKQVTNKALVSKQPAAGAENAVSHSGSTDGFRRYLQQLGLEGEIIDYLMLQVPGYLVDGGSNSTEEGWAAFCQQVLSSRIMFSEPIQNDSPSEQQIMALIGPTGVGKTTTIAKLAANYNLFEGKKVGLITIDTYRIAAVEHLKTYGDIINLPVEVVYTPADLNQSFNNLQDCNLILIDTAGRSPHNQAMMDELKKFLSHSKIGLILLAISATTKYQDMISIAENFSRIAYTHLVFTKLDETQCLGPIASLAWKIRRPISYLTTGQNVPDDIEIARSERLIAQLLKR